MYYSAVDERLGSIQCDACKDVLGFLESRILAKGCDVGTNSTCCGYSLGLSRSHMPCLTCHVPSPAEHLPHQTQAFTNSCPPLPQSCVTASPTSWHLCATSLWTMPALTCLMSCASTSLTATSVTTFTCAKLGVGCCCCCCCCVYICACARTPTARCYSTPRSYKDRGPVSEQAMCVYVIRTEKAAWRSSVHNNCNTFFFLTCG